MREKGFAMFPKLIRLGIKKIKLKELKLTCLLARISKNIYSRAY